MKIRSDSLKSGDKFGRLTVDSLSHSSKRRDGSTGERVMNCICDCGAKVAVKTSNLKSGNTTSCGCVKSEKATKSNLIRAGKISSIEDDIAYQCSCGCVSFNALKSKKIECTKCKETVCISAIF